MLADPEHYKGIFYIRISSLPSTEKSLIRATFDNSRVVKILKENSLITDCILYPDYVTWYKNTNTSLTDKLLETIVGPDEFVPEKIVR